MNIFHFSFVKCLIRHSFVRKECNLIQNAIFTDPNDQSAWFYQRWLLFSGQEKQTGHSSTPDSLLSTFKNELESCQQLYDLEPNNKWVILQICELLQRIDSLENEAEISELVAKLSIVDPLRRGYYDFLSKSLAHLLLCHLI